MPRRLSAVVGDRENNFDLLRLVAAGLVLVSHSFPLVGQHDPLEPHTLGTAGVEIFFAISGFLVTKSWLDDPRLGQFLRKRALRIFPGLIIAVLIAALVIGAVMTTLPASSYFSSRAVWTYVVSNAALLPRWLLPGVFTGNPGGHAVNGSLWTLPVEFRAYFGVAALGLLGLLTRRVALAAVVALAAGSASVGGLSPSLSIAAVFVGGSTLYLLRDSIELRGDIAVILLAAWLAAYSTPLANAASIVALPYLVVFAAYSSPRALRRLTRRGDVSYGVYVYAFPVQQALVSTAGTMPPLLLAATATPIVWLLGFASWRLVERPMLKLKRRRTVEQTVPAAMPNVTAA